MISEADTVYLYHLDSLNTSQRIISEKDPCTEILTRPSVGHFVKTNRLSIYST